MPDFAAHYIFGCQVLEALPRPARALAEQDPAAWKWGLQGPDPLFFRGLLIHKSPLPGWGGVMHRERTAQLFAAGLEYVYAHRTRPEYPTLRSYFLGFLCHYLLDKTVHPYVFWRESVLRAQLPPEYWPVFHFQIETELDNQLYPMYFGGHVLDFDPLEVYPIPQAFAVAAGGMLAGMLGQTYGLQTTGDEAGAAFGDCRFCTHLLYDSSGWAVRYLTMAIDGLTGKPQRLCSHVKGKCSGADVLNLTGQSWYNARIPHILRSDSVPRLMEQAGEEAAAFIPAYLAMLDTGDLRPIPFQAAFDDGRLEKL